MTRLRSLAYLHCGFVFTHVDLNYFTDKVKDNEPHYDLESEYSHAKAFPSRLKMCALVLLGRSSF